MRDLQAVKSFVYANRRLQAGDYFTARTTGDARVLVAIGSARGQDAPAPRTVELHPIPEAWRDLSWPALKSLAANVSDEKIKSKDDAVAAIELEIESRKVAS
jgi:hypothetical protein